MDRFGVLTGIGGLALFLYGMNVMGDGLSKLSGGKLERILEKLPYDLTNEEDAFSKDLLLLMLKQYESFVDSFEMACKSYKELTP